MFSQKTGRSVFEKTKGAESSEKQKKTASLIGSGKNKQTKTQSNNPREKRSSLIIHTKQKL